MNLMTYSSIDNKRIKDIKKLHQKKYRDEMNMFLVEGEHLVKEAYISGYLDSIILLEGTTFSLSKNDIYVTDKVMRYLSALDNYQPVMGICHKKEKKDLQNRLLLLDDIQDPGNLGTIIRSAVAFGFDSIILGLKTTDLYSSKVIRATQGLLFHINIFSMDLKELIRHGNLLW